MQISQGQIENYDSASTTPVDERVIKALIPYFTDRFANASSNYLQGRKTNEVVIQAQGAISQALNCFPDEVYFTSGGTEANNWILRGFDFSTKTGLIVSTTEHLSILHTAEILAGEGKCNLQKVGVGPTGIVNLEELETLLKSGNIGLVSIHAVNNETGTIQDIKTIYDLCKKYGAKFHTDASQAFGKIRIGFDADYITLSAHKIHGPKGIGALIIRLGEILKPILTGGHQQNSMRAGTLPVPLIVGFGKACELIEESYIKTEALRMYTEHIKTILLGYGNVVINSDTNRVPSFLNFSIETDSSDVIALMEKNYNISLSKGATCMEGRISYVLLAQGRTNAQAKNSIRISLNKFTKKDNLLTFPHLIQKCIKQLEE